MNFMSSTMFFRNRSFGNSSGFRHRGLSFKLHASSYGGRSRGRLTGRSCYSFLRVTLHHCGSFFDSGASRGLSFCALHSGPFLSLSCKCVSACRMRRLAFGFQLGDEGGDVHPVGEALLLQGIRAHGARRGLQRYEGRARTIP